MEVFGRASRAALSLGNSWRGESWNSHTSTVSGLVPGDLVSPALRCLVVVLLGRLQPVEWDLAVKLVVTFGKSVNLLPLSLISSVIRCLPYWRAVL